MKRSAASFAGIKLMAPRLVRGLAAALLLIAPFETSVAQSNYETLGSGATSRHISMGVGKSMIVDLPRDAAEIFVGNPKVANAVVRSARKLYIIGMENGQTTVFALDAQGRQIASLDISIGRDVGELHQILKIALPTSDIIVHTVNDSIILTGTVDTAEEAQRASDIAQSFARRANAGGATGAGGAASAGASTSASIAGGGASETNGSVVNSIIIRGRDQVMLKVSVAEIQRNIAKQLGITSSTLGAFTQYNPFAIQGPIAASGSGVSTGLTLHNPSNTLSATLQAFERYGVSRILAEPSVSAVSGESAKFTVGGEIPIPSAPVCTTTGSQTNCTPGGVTYQNYGITLNFAPVVLSEGRILLHLATEVTELDYQTSATIQGVAVPGLLTRKNETTVELPSGGSIASAGLLQNSSAQVINGTPGLMNLPILGSLFRSRDYQRKETELLIVVTPYLVKATSAKAIPKPDDGFADSSDPQTWLLGRINRLYSTPSNPEAMRNYKGRVGFIQD